MEKNTNLCLNTCVTAWNLLKIDCGSVWIQPVFSFVHKTCNSFCMVSTCKYYDHAFIIEWESIGCHVWLFDRSNVFFADYFLVANLEHSCNSWLWLTCDMLVQELNCLNTIHIILIDSKNNFSSLQLNLINSVNGYIENCSARKQKHHG